LYRTNPVGALSHTLDGARKRIAVHRNGMGSTNFLKAPAFVAVPRPCPRSVVYRGSDPIMGLPSDSSGVRGDLRAMYEEQSQIAEGLIRSSW